MNSKTILQPFYLIVMLLAWAAAASAQSYTVIQSFNTNASGLGGVSPLAGLTVVGTNLYGTTTYGGANGTGVIFKIHRDGTGYTEYKSFSALDGNGFNNDGANPQGELVLSGSTLYGVTQYGGTAGQGVLFSINTDGSGFTNLYSFDDTNAVSPISGLLLVGSTLFGTTQGGGAEGQGGLYSIQTDGSDYTNFYSFTGAEGDSPSVGLVVSGNTLYGTASDGPNGSADGTIFAVQTDGSGFANLYTFTTPVTDLATHTHTNQFGAGAPAKLVVSGDTLYGVTPSGGSAGEGTVFSLDLVTSNLNVLQNLSGTKNNGSFGNALLLVGDTLYGTTFFGGTEKNGTLFKVNTDGSSFSILHDFSDTSNGGNPQTSLVLLGNYIYGTASVGGAANAGAIFALSLTTVPIYLTLDTSGGGMVMTWTDPSFALQSAPTLTGVYSNVPGATSPFSTNPVSGNAFFRLFK